MTHHLLHFPCRDAVFNWFGSEAEGSAPRVTVDLLAEQREFECRPGNGARRITCQSCGHPQARYVVCYRKGKLTDKLYPRRYPGSGRWHKAGCFSHACELPSPDDGGKQTPVIGPSGDFAALRRDLGDPEFRVVAMRRRNRPQADLRRVAGARGISRMTIGLQRLARDLLQRSGVCEWRPHYATGRSERVFNGLVRGALNAITLESAGASGALINSLQGVSFVPWSYLDERDRKTSDEMTSCVGFGFVESLGPENQHGARQMQLSNHPTCPLVVPRSVLDREGRNPRSPLHSLLAHPVWVIFVAGLFEGTWKIHAMVTFRVTATGLIPVESRHEERMVERLIGEGRTFCRWLLTPPELQGTKFVPDFQLLDTALCEFLEVGGLLANEVYAANIARKKRKLGPRLLVWDTRLALDQFTLPHSETVQYQPPKRLPRDPHLASSVENGGRAKVRQHEIP